MCYISCVTFCVSHVTCHMSCVTCPMLHVICHFFPLFLDKMLEWVSRGSVIHEAYPFFCVLIFFYSFLDFTKHLTLEISFATSLLLRMGELAGGGSVDVTRNMWQSTTRHVHLSVVFFHQLCPLGRVGLVVAVCVLSPLFMWYILRPILPPLPKVGCLKFLEIRNPWGKVLERSGLRIEHFVGKCSKISAK